MMRITRRLSMDLIVAVDAAGGIGKDDNIPWVLKKDMAHFVKATRSTNDPRKRNVVLMGRKCWDSIPQHHKPLRNRLNVVVSRTKEQVTTEDIWVRNDLSKALRDLQILKENGEIERVWNIGGGEIYAWALKENLVKTIEITKIQKDFGCDVKLPEIEWEKFEEAIASDEQEEDGIKFTFHTYRKKL